MVRTTVTGVVSKGSSFSVVRLATGETIDLPNGDVNSALAAAASSSKNPNNTVIGDCGYSWMYLTDKSNGYPLSANTGFYVWPLSANYYFWQTFYSGPGATMTAQNSSKLNNINKFTLTITTSNNPSHGTWQGWVSQNNSYAQLTDGSICTSGGASDTESL